MVIALLNATATSIGTSTAKTQLNGGSNVTMPAWARNLVAIVPYQCKITETAAETLHAKVILESDDVAIVPFEVALPPVQGMLGAVPTTSASSPEKFVVNCPLKGGEEIGVYGQALVTNTVAPYVGCTLVVSDGYKAGDGRQIFGKVGTLTATGTAAAEVSGTAFSIHGSERIVEVTGSVGGTTVAASKPFMGYVRLQSNDFKVAVPLKYSVVPVTPMLGTTSGSGLTPFLARYKVNIPTNTTCTIQDYFNLEVAVTTAGYFLVNVFFQKVGR
jgi:hypothetical protein